MGGVGIVTMHRIDRHLEPGKVIWRRGDRTIGVSMVRWDTGSDKVEVHGTHEDGPMAVRVSRGDLPPELSALLA